MSSGLMHYISMCYFFVKMKIRHRFILLLVCLLLVSLYLCNRKSKVNHLTEIEEDIGRVSPRNFLSEMRKQQNKKPKHCHFAENILDSGAIDTSKLVSEVWKNVKLKKGVTKGTNEHVTVFLIPHTHTDPGWLMTVREYYDKQVKNILDNMVVKMFEYPEMTFNWAETVFLAMWWNETTSENKRKFQKLVDRGQIEIINGGWVAPDEASTHYFAIIDQLIEGHQWIYQNLGVIPTVGWSPDPFGYSGTMPYLLRKADMRDMVIVRIHDQIKSRLRREMNNEVLWRQPWALGSTKTDAFCHIMPWLYNSFDYSCGPHPRVCGQFDFLTADGIVGDNVQEKAQAIAEQFRMKSLLFRHNVIFHTVGGDFRYDTPQEWDRQYQNYAYLSKHINNDTKLHMQVKFGTMSEYFKAAKAGLAKTRKGLRKGAGVNVLHGDWFPYMDVGDQYWSGCYTSRAFWKQLGRELEGDLRAAEILNSLARVKAKPEVLYDQTETLTWLSGARKELALFQHHDAITGTSKEHVMKDYGMRLLRAKALVTKVSESAAGSLLVPEGVTKLIFTLDDVRGPNQPFRYRHTLKINAVAQPIAIFNPTAKIRTELIILRVDRRDVIVENTNGWPINSQINSIWLSKTRKFDDKSYELVFYAEFHPLSFDIFEIKATTSKNPHTTIAKNSFILKNRKSYKSFSDFEVRSKILHVTFDSRGKMKSVGHRDDDREVLISNKFMTYNSANSGAYIFQPKIPPEDVMFNQPNFVLKTVGPVVTDIRTGYGRLEHRVRIFHTKSTLGASLEIENHVDMTSISADMEIFMRFNTSIKNGKLLYTDSNGFQMFRRERQDAFPVGGRFYPISDACYIEGNGTRLSLLSGQPNGVASLEEGQLDVIIDRKVSRDDGKGLGEGAKDNKPTTSRFLLLIEHPKGGAPRKNEAELVPYQSLLAQSLLEHLLHPALKFVARSQEKILKFTPLIQPFPCDVDLVNLRTTDLGTGVATVMILHRRGFRCGFETDDSCRLVNGDLDIKKLFPFVKRITEMSLSLLNVKKDVPKGIIHLDPMEIGAYKLAFNK